jgi:GTP-binding protein EngB required for normal cell division
VNPFNPLQARSVANVFQDVHRRLAEIEAMIAQAEPQSPFSEYVPDLSPTEARVLRDYFARIRAAMLGLLRDCDIPLGVRQTSLRWGTQVHLSMLSVSLADLDPGHLRGYGALSEAGRERAVRLRQELDRLVSRAHAFLARQHGPELADRLARLGNTGGADDLRLIDRVVTRWGLVEFRPQLDALARRLEAPEFEIAVFGRVSSGKSSLLNHIAGADVLPVGVTPVTAVPTRLARGDAPECVVTTAESSPWAVPVAELREYASEEGNPGNHKHVTDILVRVPAPRLPDGVVLVDTPGVGSLALAGAAETMAYLPRCDLGVVLVDAASTLNADDLGLIHALADAGTPVQVLMSKADLLSPADRKKSLGYIRDQLRRELGTDVPVHAVSTVGADEALLTRWFEGEIEPLLRRHRELVGESIRRKVAALRGAVAAVLQTMARRPAGAGDRTPEVLSQARSLLESADRAVTAFRGRVWDWAGNPDPLVEQVLREVGRGDGTGGVAGAAGRVLADRGRAALHLARELQETLGRTLEGLAGTGLVAEVDPAAVYRVALRNLPDADLGSLSDAGNGRLPWWGALPALTVPALRKRFGGLLRELVGGYDRALQLWLKTTQQQLVEAFESQAEVVREQVRRLGAEPGAAADGPDEAALAADIRDLLGGDAPAPGPLDITFPPAARPDHQSTQVVPAQKEP